MKKFAGLVMLLILVASWLSACEWSSNDPPTVILTTEDNGRTIGLPLNANLQVILKGNPSTGYQWQTVVINPGLLGYQGMEYNPDSTDVGSGGTYVFNYQADTVGTTPLQLNYSDTNNLNTAQTFIVTVNITAR